MNNEQKDIFPVDGPLCARERWLIALLFLAPLSIVAHALYSDIDGGGMKWDDIIPIILMVIQVVIVVRTYQNYKSSPLVRTKKMVNYSVLSFLCSVAMMFFVFRYLHT